MSWNGYPSFTRNAIIKQSKKPKQRVENENNNRKVIWLRLPYLGKISDKMKKKLFSKSTKMFERKCSFRYLISNKENSYVLFC